MTGSDQNLALAMVRQLAAWKVKVVFGVSGDDVLPFLDALARDGTIRYVGAAHEAGAGFMASSWAKLTGELGVCLASAAGAVNLTEGLADAYLDGAPVLAITGQVKTGSIGTQAKQYFNQQCLIGNFAGYSELVTDASAGPRLLIRAMAQALTRQSVAHLSVPADLWSRPVQAEPGAFPALVREAADRNGFNRNGLNGKYSLDDDAGSGAVPEIARGVASGTVPGPAPGAGSETAPPAGAGLRSEAGAKAGPGTGSEAEARAVENGSGDSSKKASSPPGSAQLLRRGVENGAGGRYILGDLDRAADLMRRARKPVLVVGARARDAISEIGCLASTWGAAVVVAQEAKGVVPNNWPRVLGGVGEAWIPRPVAETDCIVMVGSAGFEESFLPKVATIQIELEPWSVKETYLWDSLAGPVPQIITVLTEKLNGYVPDPAWSQQVDSARQELERITAADARERDPNGPIHPAALMQALSTLVAEDAVIAVDEGAFSHWFDRDFQAKDQQVLVSARWRSMGAALPGAIAAQLRFPGRQVLALVGDGSLLMSLGEFTTAVKYNLPIAVLVANNRLFALEKDKTLAARLEPLGLEVSAPDFSQYAQACGARGFRVEKSHQIEDVLRQALTHQGPALVDVICEDVRLPLQVSKV